MRPLAARRANSGGGSDRDYHDDGDPVGHLVQTLRERDALFRMRGRLVEVVEDEHAWSGQRREEIAEEGPDEADEIVLRLGSEYGQPIRNPPCELAGREPEVVDERRAVDVADVAVVPEVRQVSRLQVARDERRLADAGGAAKPDDGPRRGFVEQREQARSRNGVVQPGPRQLGERLRYAARPARSGGQGRI